MIKGIFGLAATGMLALSGCTMADGSSAQPADSAAAADASNRLVDTNWQLVEFQSMDDAQGTSRPKNPDKYTMSLGAGGNAALGLDCNRGTGTWTGADGTSGSITFGPIASTKALCGPDTMGEKLARDFGYVRSYIMRGGRLYLSLMADGGIYVWEPAPDN